MAQWLDPIFDRTQEDVEFALAQIAEWVATNITNPMVVYDLKGCLNASDINRIEGNIEYLAERLTAYYYPPPNISTNTWTSAGMPNERDISRILNNIQALIDVFYMHKDAPPVPSRIDGYEELNDVEENLYLIKELLDAMVNSFKKSGTLYSGSVMCLPIRR